MLSKLRSNLMGHGCVRSWHCSACRSVLKNAVQLVCGERMCEVCAVGLGQFPFCPVCKEVLEERHYDGSYFFPDIYIRKMIDKNGHVDCDQQICSWRGQISDHQAHFDEFHNMFAPAKSSGDGFQADGASNSSPCVKKFPVNLVSLQQLHPNNVPANMLTSNSSREQGLPRAVDDHDSFVFQEGIHNKYSTAKEKALCAGCGHWVSYDDLEAHRNSCYKCHLYNGNCYRIVNGPQEESGLQFGGELQLGNHGQTDLLVRLVVSNVFGVVDDVCDIFNGLEGRINQFQMQIKNEFTKKSPIEYPIIGTMSWKISNLSLRLCDFENPSILSSPFYSSERGYKMRLKLDFHRTVDRDPVLSLSLLIVEGENDKFLMWPFTREVTFGLLSFGKSDGIYTIHKPENPVTRCYSEDRGTRVVRYSWTLHQSGKFVQDDCLFIKCTV